MYEAVEDGIGQGGIADDVVPFVDGKLTGDLGRSGAVSILQYLQQIATMLCRRFGQSPVIEDDDIGLRRLMKDINFRWTRTPLTTTRHRRRLVQFCFDQNDARMRDDGLEEDARELKEATVHWRTAPYRQLRRRERPAQGVRVR